MCLLSSGFSSIFDAKIAQVFPPVHVFESMRAILIENKVEHHSIVSNNNSKFNLFDLFSFIFFTND